MGRLDGAIEVPSRSVVILFRSRWRITVRVVADLLQVIAFSGVVAELSRAAASCGAVVQGAVAGSCFQLPLQTATSPFVVSQ